MIKIKKINKFIKIRKSQIDHAYNEITHCHDSKFIETLLHRIECNKRAIKRAKQL